MAELQAKLAAKVRSQTSAGIDPEYLILGGEMVALYIEAGNKRFAQMLRDFADATGLTGLSQPAVGHIKAKANGQIFLFG